MLTWALGSLFAYIVFSCTSTFQKSNDEAARIEASKTAEQKQAELEQARADDAKWACKAFVTNALKAPTTAKFPNYQDFHAIPNGPNEYIVQGYVDSQNSFGAMIRTSFDCTTRQDSPGSWQLIGLRTN